MNFISGVTQICERSFLRVRSKLGDAFRVGCVQIAVAKIGKIGKTRYASSGESDENYWNVEAPAET